MDIYNTESLVSLEYMADQGFQPFAEYCPYCGSSQHTLENCPEIDNNLE